MNDMLRIGDLTAAELEAAVALAGEMKAEPLALRDALAGGSLACVIEDPATRAHIEGATAARRLGLLPVMLTRREVAELRADPGGDLARVLSVYAAGLLVGALTQRALRELARVSTVPVVNAISDEEDPIQAVADLLTLREHVGPLEGLALAYVGAGDCPVVHSLLEAGARSGLDLRVACPPERRPIREIAVATEALAEAHGGRIRILDDPQEAVAGAAIVYTAAWPKGADERYQVDTALLRRAGPAARFMHPLPAFRGHEVTTAVIEGPRALVAEQAANRLPAAQAAIYAVVR
jgi:ornithine carbamoyltransferase